MEFEKLQNVNNGLRCFDTATYSTSLYVWVEEGATYFSVLGCDILQYAIKINPDDTISFGSGGSFVTVDTIQTITGEKTFSTNTIFSSTVKMSGLPGLVPYPYYEGSLMSVDNDGSLITVSACSLPYIPIDMENGYVTVDTAQTITGGKTFSSAEMYFTGLQTTLTTGYTGNLMAINDSGRPSKVSVASLAVSGNFVTLDTAQTITGGKTFSSAEMYFSGLELESTPTTGGFAIIRGNKVRYCPWSTVSGLIGGGGGNFVTLDTAQTISGVKTFSAGTIYAPNLNLYFATQSPDYLVGFINDGFYKVQSAWMVTRDKAQSISGHKTFSELTVNKLYTAGQLTSPTYFLTIDGAGQIFWSYAGSSSIRIKKDVEDIIPKNYNLIHSLRPIWHRYNVPTDTPEEWGWYGLIAEEVAELIPQLVIYDYDREDYEEDKGTKEGKKLHSGAIRKPVGVRYDRLAVLMLPELQNLRKENDDLRKRVGDLEAIVTKISAMIQ